MGQGMVLWLIKEVRNMKKFGLILMLVATMSMVLVGCGPSFKDGAYTGTGKGMNGDIEVSVDVKDGKISKVVVTSHKESKVISDAAIEQIPASIVEKNSTKVDVVSNATNTSNGIIRAVNKALEGAK